MAGNVPALGEVAAFLIVYCKDIKISIRHISVLEKLNQPLRETAVARNVSVVLLSFEFVYFSVISFNLSSAFGYVSFI